MTKLSARLPDSNELNGFHAINSALVEHTDGAFICLMVVDCKTITKDADTGQEEATARIRRIEPVAVMDRDRAAQMMVRATEDRTGQTLLPIELEDDLRQLLTVNFETGEISDTNGDADGGDDE